MSWKTVIVLELENGASGQEVGGQGCRQGGLAIAGSTSNLVAESARFEECDRGG